MNLGSYAVFSQLVLVEEAVQVILRPYRFVPRELWIARSRHARIFARPVPQRDTGCVNDVRI